MNLPKSSPARANEFPPPLFMFPRTKSTRRTRSRANPRFIRKVITGNESNGQEPSSPKVSCIGQVRVKRVNNKQTTSSSSWSAAAVLRRPRWFRRIWRAKISVFRCDCCRRSEKLQESTADRIRACEDELISEFPARNAVLLTRSRSAPYRCSSGGNETVSDGIEGVGEDIGGDDGGFINGGEEKVKTVNLSMCKSEPARNGDKLFMSFSFSS